MKNKRIFSFMAMLGLLSMLASCGSSGTITKRYHSRGYQISLSWLKKDQSVSPAPVLVMPRPAMAIPAEQFASKVVSVNALPGDSEPPRPCKAEIKAELAKVKTAVKASAAEAKTAVQSGIAAAGPMLAGIKPALQDAKPELKKATEKVEGAARKVKNIDDMQLIAAIVAIFLPFIGVLLYEGTVTTHFWIALLLWILGILPGIVYAWLVIFNVIG